MFEGGIRVPFAMHWKGFVPAGQTYREPVMGFDCHATALAVAGVTVPEAKPLDGVNLIPFVTGKRSGRPHERLLWRAGQQHAARVGDWKLVNTRNAPPMLFNLKDDVGEQKTSRPVTPTSSRNCKPHSPSGRKGLNRRSGSGKTNGTPNRAGS